jgi:23S rRNA pseudouridine2605 synthase
MNVEKIRIAKLIARSGKYSRRQAEQLVFEGKVRVDSTLVLTPAEKFTSDANIYVDGVMLPKFEKARLVAFHKPKGYLCTRVDTHERKTIYDILPKEFRGFHYIGRLDMNSEGLLLLTNDAELKRKMELPESNIVRKYKVRFHGHLRDRDIAAIENGVTIDGMRYKPAKISNIRKTGTNSWLEIELCEGKNREIRKIFEHFKCEVNRLIRVQFGSYLLDNCNIAISVAKEIAIQ